ncbi:peptidoglycan editing factor PgeF [Jeotgalibacillus soli]|uniref:Purine nucleoside phosphorylase n=1 Tax=Jeotgalibacillus soli TaxID=889306 RepID=A0A0C2V772_9BACL|nr:peptidoglycan editing factor PgeF [Jeotgalibacillus soli]KIL44807.1 hypothetical protein KP78_23510 [Jeotgalibacillus soli]
MEIMTSISSSALKVEEWDKAFPSLVAAFSTKNGGCSSGDFLSLNTGLHVKDREEDVVYNRSCLGNQIHAPLSKWVLADQVHGSKIQHVSAGDCGRGTLKYENAIPDTDGLWTTDLNVFLSLCYADCVPLLFVEPTSRFVGAAHAGWKGTVQNIAGKMILEAQNAGVDIDQLQAVIGPSIGPCCYIVDEYVINQVNNVLANEKQKPYQEISDGQFRLDLKQLNKLLLLQAGLKGQQILSSILCTSCEDQLFFSHRRDRGKTGRMMAVIGWKG